MINELVANAIEHAFPNGGGRIEVRLVREDDEPVLIVRDNGAGFAEAQSESIGLSTAQRLVAAAGGQLTRTDADSGTSWTIRLPPTSLPGATEETTRAAPVRG